MTTRNTLGILAINVVVAAISCFTLTNTAGAATTAPTITYTAAGTFGSTPASGADTLKLGGEPFSVSIAVLSSTKPYKTGKNWAAYNKLKLTGAVHSGLLGATPVNIASSEASIIQAINPGQADTLTLQAPVKVVGISLTLKAVIIMPSGTISKPLLAPFAAPVQLSPANATLTYADGANTTTLVIESGSLTATVPAGATSTAGAVMLHSAGAQIIMLHGDGTTSVRSVGAEAVDLGFSTDTTVLKFYASGVSNASAVHVQIAGEEVPVLYAGASGYFPGLDEVMVQAPVSLVGRGATTVTLTADGQAGEPIRIQIQ